MRRNSNSQADMEIPSERKETSLQPDMRSGVKPGAKVVRNIAKKPWIEKNHGNKPRREPDGEKDRGERSG